MNVIIKLVKMHHKDPREWVKLSNPAQINGQEFDITEPIESIIVRCGPYDNSELIEIKRNEDTNEIMVIHHSNVLEMPEIVLSVLEETP